MTMQEWNEMETKRMKADSLKHLSHCSDHAGAPFIFYCSSHFALLCVGCTAKGEKHANCDFIRVQEAISKVRPEMQKVRDEIASKGAEICELAKSSDELKQQQQGKW